MAKQSSDSYSTTSLINIASDPFTVNAGTVTRNGGTMTFTYNSRCTFNKTFGSKGLNTRKLKVEYNVDTDGLSTRYNNNIYVQLKIQFYEREYTNGEYTYSNGVYQTIDIMPYSSDEEKGNYKNDIIDLDGQFIKSMQIIIRFNGTGGTIDLTKLNIYYTVDIDEDSFNNYADRWANDNFSDYYDNMVQQVGTYIEPRTSDPSGSELYAGRIWLRVDLIE